MKLLEVLPFLDLLPIVHYDVRLVRGCGGSKVDPSWTPVLELLLRRRLDASDKFLHRLQ